VLETYVLPNKDLFYSGVDTNKITSVFSTPESVYLMHPALRKSGMMTQTWQQRTFMGDEADIAVQENEVVFSDRSGMSK